MGLIGSFLGKDQRKELAGAKTASDAALKQGYDTARPDFDQAVAGFGSYTQSGQQQQKLYDDLMGINGPEARAAAQQIYASDPYQQAGLNQGLNAMQRMGNARGWGSGKYALAGTRIANENYGNWMDRFRSGGEMGLNATSQQAGALTNRGNLAYGYGATKAGQATNYGNAMAEARGIGVNNLLKVGEIAATAFGGGMKGGGKK